jgi:hypothetical protein
MASMQPCVDFSVLENVQENVLENGRYEKGISHPGSKILVPLWRLR